MEWHDGVSYDLIGMQSEMFLLRKYSIPVLTDTMYDMYDTCSHPVKY